MKKIIVPVIIVLAVVFLIVAAKDLIIKVAVEKGVELTTGLPLKIKSLKIGTVSTLVDINGLRLLNPSGFKDRVMLDMPEVYVDYDLPAIIKGTIHLKEVRIDLKEFVVVKNAKEELNLDALKTVQKEKAPKKEEAREKGKAPKFKIDLLELKVGKVVYKDYSAGAVPSVREFNVNIDEKFRDIENPDKLVSLIVVKALSKTAIAKLTNFDLKGLQGSLGNIVSPKIMSKTSGALTEAKEKAGKFLSPLFSRD